jgi:flagellar hook-length control protein FliK
VAHLGAASHYSLQHTQTDTSTGELKSTLGSAAWTDELGGQLTWMTHRGLESGSLRVSPEHLGPVEVQISVQNGDASVWFGASHPDTRAALEQALPRLREMFANQGLTLTDSGVSRESPRQNRSSAPQSVAAVSAVGSSDVSVSAAVRLSLGLVDTYA